VVSGSPKRMLPLGFVVVLNFLLVTGKVLSGISVVEGTVLDGVVIC